ncbi:MAG TPA: hypothetical protein VFA81_06530 [Burkholderiales bacterium]|nr:hypothetical protein [Burkholderiales bacterium]
MGWNLMGLINEEAEAQSEAQSQPWFGEYQALKQQLWNGLDSQSFVDAANQIAAKYGIAGQPGNLLGQMAGKDLADHQGSRAPWYKDDSGISPAQGVGIGVTLGTGAAAAGGAAGLGTAGTTAGTSAGVGAGTGLSEYAAADTSLGLGTTAAATGGTGASTMAGYDLGGGLTVDEFGNITGASDSLSTAGSGDFFNPMGGGGSIFDTLGNGLNGLSNIFGSGGLGSLLSGIGGLLPKNPLNLLPGAMALGYAGMQPGLDVGPLQGILGQLGGNQDAVIRAATDPVQANIAAGYGDLLQSQSLRGIRGSSFGDTDIANYLSTTGRSLGDTAANAAQGSLALQGGLASQIAELKNQAQQIKNNLYGRAFDVLGRGLNPSGYASNINVGGAGSPAPAPASTLSSDLGNWMKAGSGALSLGKSLYGLFA